MPNLNVTQRRIDFSRPLKYHISTGQVRDAEFVGVLNSSPTYEQRFNNVVKIKHRDPSKDYIRFVDDYGAVTSLNDYDDVKEHVIKNTPKKVTATIFVYFNERSGELETRTSEVTETGLVLNDAIEVTHTV